MIESIFTNRLESPYTMQTPSAAQSVPGTSFEDELTSVLNAHAEARTGLRSSSTPAPPSPVSSSDPPLSTSTSATSTTTTTVGPSSSGSTTATSPGINNWQQWLTSYDPQTGEVNSPFANPFMTNPTETNPNGTVTSLNPSNWATETFAQQVASELGGQVTTTPPAWAGGSLAGGFSYNQPHYYVSLPNGTTIDPADLANLFTHGYPVAVLQQAIPQFLGISGSTSLPT